MVPLILLFVCSALASGPPVATEPEDCIANNGYLNGLDFGQDCCSFVVCDSTRLNKTGFVGKCMGGTGWNDALKVCDDKKYLEDCEPADCDVPARTNALCPAPQPTASSCCLGQRVEQGFPGYEPVFYAGADEFSYRIGEDSPRNEAVCPLGMIFSLESCCCEDAPADLLPPCDDLGGYFFDNPDDPCCSYIQCYPNRTAFEVVACMPPSVWNSENATCDIAVNVMECMDAMCGDEVTDEPCEDPPTQGDCCQAGNYFQATDDPIQYLIVAGPAASDRLQCCPLDMQGNQLEFNNDPEVCTCELPAEF